MHSRKCIWFGAEALDEHTTQQLQENVDIV